MLKIVDANDQVTYKLEKMILPCKKAEVKTKMGCKDVVVMKSFPANEKGKAKAEAFLNEVQKEQKKDSERPRDSSQVRTE